MAVRMDKYENDTPELKKRTDKFATLYEKDDSQNYSEFDVNSNVSVLKTHARSIDVNQIRDMLDKKYRDNIPKRKSIALETEEEVLDRVKEDTKEYDLNAILDKAKQEKTITYEEERLSKKPMASEELIEEINRKYRPKAPDAQEEAELLNLINTITELEMKNQKKNAELLGLDDNADDENIKQAEILNTNDKDEEDNEESFYTGKLAINDKDFDDFKDISDDIKSNSVLIKILIFIFILSLLAVGVYVINKYFDLGLF